MSGAGFDNHASEASSTAAGIAASTQALGLMLPQTPPTVGPALLSGTGLSGFTVHADNVARLAAQVGGSFLLQNALIGQFSGPEHPLLTQRGMSRLHYVQPSAASLSTQSYMALSQMYPGVQSGCGATGAPGLLRPAAWAGGAPGAACGLLSMGDLGGSLANESGTVANSGGMGPPAPDAHGVPLRIASGDGMLQQQQQLQQQILLLGQQESKILEQLEAIKGQGSYPSPATVGSSGINAFLRGAAPPPTPPAAAAPAATAAAVASVSGPPYPKSGSLPSVQGQQQPQQQQQQLPTDKASQRPTTEGKNKSMDRGLDLGLNLSLHHTVSQTEEFAEALNSGRPSSMQALTSTGMEVAAAQVSCGDSPQGTATVVRAPSSPVPTACTDSPASTGLPTLMSPGSLFGLTSSVGAAPADSMGGQNPGSKGARLISELAPIQKKGQDWTSRAGSFQEAGGGKLDLDLNSAPAEERLQLSSKLADVIKGLGKKRRPGRGSGGSSAARDVGGTVEVKAVVATGVDGKGGSEEIGEEASAPDPSSGSTTKLEALLRSAAARAAEAAAAERGEAGSPGSTQGGAGMLVKSDSREGGKRARESGGGGLEGSSSGAMSKPWAAIPGFYSRRNATDGTFTPCRLPRCLESLVSLSENESRLPASPAVLQLSKEEMTQRLEAFARAVEAKDKEAVKVIERELRLASSSSGTAVQRIGFQFVRALKVRAVTHQVEQFYHPPDQYHKRTLRSMMHYVETVPFFRLIMQAGLATLAEALADHPRVHLVIVGNPVLSVTQFPVLLGLLARRAKGPPKSLRITTIDASFRPSGAREMRTRDEKIRVLSRKLHEQAAKSGIAEFECSHVSIGAQDTLHRLDEIEARRVWECEAGGTKRKGNDGGVIRGGAGEAEQERESLFLFFCYCLYSTPDQNCHKMNLKDHLIQWAATLEPDEIVIVEGDWQVNVSSFMGRFQACLRQMLIFFLCHDDLAADHLSEVLWHEDHHMGQLILNIVAGEGDQIVVHAERHEPTINRFLACGLAQVSVRAAVVENIGREMDRSCHPKIEMTIEKGGTTLILKWEGHPIMFLCAFKKATSTS